jgi:hypothetical protein
MSSSQRLFAKRTSVRTKRRGERCGRRSIRGRRRREKRALRLRRIGDETSEAELIT